MVNIYSFLPITSPDARVLILGSMPGERSLAAGQYYAHPHNIFWKVFGELIGAGSDMIYARRLEILKAHRIGLWDVMESCSRKGSLDSAIEESSIRPNNFAELYLRHPHLTHVFFNGKKAEASYKRYVSKSLDPSHAHLHYKSLPSTSPANASINYQDKKRAWEEILRATLI